ncbi:MAG: sodium ABC transporter ATP-binding protein [Candidatus Meridianibacter frigidus]|nr:MAG: sodium ABC transporter ATP-binding protein [Candidatus Eremiobacteraeota bacterium]
MLSVLHVKKSFGPVPAVRDVSFEIERGATFGLLGPNGAGKTTTMRMILGILTADEGSITWNGTRIDGRMRRRFGYLPEERGLYAKMKVREQIAFFGRLHGMTEPAITERTDYWIAHLRLQEYAKRPAGELSKGNQQKVQVACCAVHEPELLVLDEPFSGLDPVNAETLMSTLKELQSRGTTLVLSSHQMWQLEELCTRFCIISDGENRAAGTLAELRAAWPTRVLRVEPGSSAVEAVLQTVPGAHRLGSQEGRLDYQVPANADFPGTLRALVSAEAVTRFESIEPSLQDVYLRAIGAAA